MNGLKHFCMCFIGNRSLSMDTNYGRPENGNLRGACLLGRSFKFWTRLFHVHVVWTEYKDDIHATAKMVRSFF